MTNFYKGKGKKITDTNWKHWHQVVRRLLPCSFPARHEQKEVASSAVRSGRDGELTLIPRAIALSEEVPMLNSTFLFT